MTELKNTTMADRRAARLEREAAGDVGPERMARSLRAGNNAQNEFSITQVDEVASFTPIGTGGVARWSDGRIRSDGLGRV